MFSLLYIILSICTLIIVPHVRRKYVLVTLLISALAFGIVALFMTPNEGVFIDSIRFFGELDQLRSVRYFSGIIDSWRYCLDKINYSGVPIAGLYILMISLIKSNAFLLGITAFIQIIFAFIWIKKIADDSENFNRSIFWGLFFFLAWFNFMASVSGVRNMTAFIIFGYLTYISFQEDKFRIINWIMSFSLCFFHSSILIFFVIRVFCYIIWSKKLNYIFNLVLFLNRFIQQSVLVFLSYFSNFPFIDQILFKSEQYLGANAYIGATSDFSQIRNLVKLLTVVILFMLYRKYSNRKFSIKYDNFFISTVCFSIGSFFDYILFGRTVNLIVFLTIPYFMTIFCQKKYTINSDWKKIIFFCAFLFIFGVTVFITVDNARAALRFVHLSLSNF
ncbi:EpsG family protein [Enterococcus malodoratus]|uniref:EpsG family protein n=1 Tax=Enterococcus malodoratus TaxID=71451 RepID=UPI0039B0CBEC